MGKFQAFFFEQTAFRKTPKRYRKTAEELPQSLRFAHLNPKVAAYLATKANIQKDDDSDSEKRGLLPDINQSFNLIRGGLDNNLDNDEDAQKYYFEDAKINSGNVLDELSNFLYLFNDEPPSIPRSVEYQLQCSHKELVTDAKYTYREWQTQAMNDANPPKNFGDVKSEDSRDRDSAAGEDIKMEKKKSANMLTLDNIREDHSQTRRCGSAVSQVPSIISRKDSHKIKPHTAPGPKTRLEKYKAVHSESRAGSSNEGRRSSNRHYLHPGDDTASVSSHMMSDRLSEAGSRAVANQERNSYYQVINFQLSSKQCEEKGWIIQPDSRDDKETETILEWARQRLQLSIQQKHEQQSTDRAKGMGKPSIVRYYGDNTRKDAMTKYRKSATKSAALAKGAKPRIPNLSAIEKTNEGKKLLMVQVADGSATVFYPSGRTAIIHSAGANSHPGTYTLVYDDTPDKKLLAVFTPTGRGSCYHANGNVRFVATPEGGTVSEIDGSISKRWKWPPNSCKLPASIVFNLSAHLMFRCLNLQQMQLFFQCQKENVKFGVGLADGASEPSKQDLGYLSTGISFSSEAAKEFEKPSKQQKQEMKKKPKGNLKSIKEKTTSVAELKKVLDFPEMVMNDVDAEKDLIKVQRKIKNLVEDWMEHYRIAIGMSVPTHNLKDTPDIPTKRRDIKSAKSTIGSSRPVIEDLKEDGEDIVRKKRAPSAPPGSMQKDRPGSSVTEITEGGLNKSSVKFNDKVYETEILDGASIAQSRATPNIGNTRSLVGSAGTTRTFQSSPHKSPLTLPHERTWSPPRGTCPVALRAEMLGEERPMCKCTRHKVPVIKDIEYDEFVRHQVPERQLIVVGIVTTYFPHANPSMEMLEHIYSEKSKNRTRPCLQARNDPFRLLLYDIVTASEMADHSQPLLLRRHNVVPGMFLMYEGGKLLFCDHIFNGYGNARKDFNKQIMKTRREATLHFSLPPDFKFSPSKGRRGPRSAWGGQIGGAGVDRHGSAGATLESTILNKADSDTSSDTGLIATNNQKNASPLPSSKFVNWTLSPSAYFPREKMRPSTSAATPVRTPNATSLHISA
ncbi:unnamed protein product [Owenia fusiformis]|uniref:Uncharacterized protein n=1 Tax=Owenia fusiformis TaxID=6347 RepID=A0A8J1T4S1_OWEFU|nr:unnamed protein product [Owenia fusiformis]